MRTEPILHGFKVRRKREISELKAELYELHHEKSGADLIWLDRPEQNKTFCVSFKTIPENDTGVFHILEHSVLGGSKKYKVKDPFAELLKSSVNTFLNAITFSDKTMYPVASRNEADFLNLVDVYLDAVFQPAVLEDPNIFYQEGWHYAFNDQGQPFYQGVVYNEMKGASSSLDSKA
ncbi:MAG: insulinase family protein, partial [Clostridiaceae bacterium]|nr:insulinase family protein [Clostridiaceae bacterium]